MSNEKWIQGATDNMKSKETIGTFGKVTKKKVAAGIKKGGKAEKKAVFAENMKRIADKKKGGSK